MILVVMAIIALIEDITGEMQQAEQKVAGQTFCGDDFVSVWKLMCKMKHLRAKRQKRSIGNSLHIIWVNRFKNGPSKICGKQPLKNLK